jgi:hypothetical protein
VLETLYQGLYTGTYSDSDAERTVGLLALGKTREAASFLRQVSDQPLPADELDLGSLMIQSNHEKMLTVSGSVRSNGIGISTISSPVCSQEHLKLSFKPDGMRMTYPDGSWSEKGSVGRYSSYLWKRYLTTP